MTEDIELTADELALLQGEPIGLPPEPELDVKPRRTRRPRTLPDEGGLVPTDPVLTDPVLDGPVLIEVEIDEPVANPDRVQADETPIEQDQAPTADELNIELKAAATKIDRIGEHIAEERERIDHPLAPPAQMRYPDNDPWGLLPAQMRHHEDGTPWWNEK